MNTPTPSAAKFLKKLSIREKQAIRNRLRNPIATIKYVKDKYQIGLKLAKEVVDALK